MGRGTRLRIWIRVLALLPLLGLASTHSWPEALYNILPDGTFEQNPTSVSNVGGYPRSFYPRSKPGYHDTLMQRQMNPPATQDGPLCNSIRADNQTASFPRLQSAPGGRIALLYQENGHVSLPMTQAGKPFNRGTIYIYGTTNPKDREIFNQIHKVWTPDGRGGDGRGRLLAVQNFDDGQCHQTNGGAIASIRQKANNFKSQDPWGTDTWCQNNIVLPDTLAKGQTMSLYWVWDWPTLKTASSAAKNETYTSCSDVDISRDLKDIASKATAAKGFHPGAMHAAIGSYLPHIQQGKNIFVQVPSVANDAPEAASMTNLAAIPLRTGISAVAAPLAAAGGSPTQTSSTTHTSSITHTSSTTHTSSPTQTSSTTLRSLVASTPLSTELATQSSTSDQPQAVSLTTTTVTIAAIPSTTQPSTTPLRNDANTRSTTASTTEQTARAAIAAPPSPIMVTYTESSTTGIAYVPAPTTTLSASSPAAVAATPSNPNPRVAALASTSGQDTECSKMGSKRSRIFGGTNLEGREANDSTATRELEEERFERLRARKLRYSRP